MPTQLLDLLTTASGVGFVCSLAAVGVAVLPWSRGETDVAGHAFAALAALPLQLVRAAAHPHVAFAPARSNQGL